MQDGTTDEECERAALEFERQWEEQNARFDELMASCGGPADIHGLGETMGDSHYRMMASFYSWDVVRPILLQHVKAKRGKPIPGSTLLRYWPAINDALHRYKSARRDLEGSPYSYPVDQSPAEIEQLFLRIANNTSQLCYDLAVIEKIANLPPHPNAPQERQYLDHWNRRLRRAIANGGGRHAQYCFEPREEPNPYNIHDALNVIFQGSLESLGDETQEILGKEFDRQLLHRNGDRDDPALHILVGWIAIIWEEITGRKATAEKDARIDRPDDASDFVMFVQDLVELAGYSDKPTPSKVRLSLQPHKDRTRKISS